MRASRALVFFSLRWRSRWLCHLANQPGACQEGRLVLGEGVICQHRGVSDDGSVSVPVDVGLPLPARRVGMASADELGLQALEFLLVAELVGLEMN